MADTPERGPGAELGPEPEPKPDETDRWDLSDSPAGSVPSDSEDQDDRVDGTGLQNVRPLFPRSGPRPPTRIARPAASAASMSSAGRTKRVIGADPANPPMRGGPAPFSAAASLPSPPSLVPPVNGRRSGAGTGGASVTVLRSGQSTRPVRDAPAEAPRGALAGAIRGPIRIGAVRRRFRGFKLLGATLLVTIVAAPVVAGFSRHRGALPWVGADEALALVILLPMLIAGTSRGGAIGDLAYSGRTFLPRRRRRAVLLRGADLRVMPRPGAPRDFSTAVHRFRVEEFTGATHACSFTGEQDLSILADGDLVQVTGRRSRQGEFVVREVAVLGSATGAPAVRISVSRRGEFAVARAANRVALCLCAALLAALAVTAAVLFR